MTLRYYFNDEEFEYELEYSEIYDYFNGVPNEELIKYLEQEFDNMSKKEQAEIITDLSDDPITLIKRKEGTSITYVPNFKQLIDDDKSWCIDTFLYDNLDQYEDELKQYFEDDAYEAYKEESDYSERSREYRDMITPAGGWR